MTSYRPPRGNRITVNATHLPRLALIAAAVLLLAGRPAAAEFGVCPAPASMVPDFESSERRAEDAPVRTDADTGHYDRATQTFTFTGDVVLERADQVLEADRVRYHQPSNRVDAEGNLRLRQDAVSLRASDGYLYLDESRGQLNDVEFSLGPTVHGSARQVRLRNESLSELDQVRYTACPPGDEDWWLSSRELELDRAAGFGTARGATLRFFGVPLLYTPYITFPIDDRRKTGVLPPRLGYNGDNGLDLAVPYYLNLAPNYDATLTPRLISRRGLMLETEGRLLRPGFATELGFNYLPDDSRYGDDRWQTAFDFRSRWRGNAYLWADYNRVSDDDYLDDFGNDLATVSEQQLSSRIVAGYRTDGWRLQALAQSWQTLDDGVERPYRVLPRLTADYQRPAADSDLSYGFTADTAHFALPGDDDRDTGIRTDLQLRTSLRHERQAYYLIPSAAIHHTRYALDRPGSPMAPESPERTVPLFSLDSGVFLERDLQLGRRSLLQTLEPRLFYLYVPYRNQSDLPLFDTSRADLTLAQLFETNRFTGLDRIGDANYAALAVSTRLLDTASGRELLRAGIGRAFYFEDRKVTLRGEQLSEDRRSQSDLLADLRANAGPLTLYANLRYDTDEDEAVRRSLRLSYRPGPWRAINLGYSYRSPRLSDQWEPLEQAELSAVWPINNRWLALGGWHYSLRDSLTLERFAGIAYNSCCWTLRTVVREHVTSTTDDPRLSFMLQLELTGLGSLGQRLDTFIEEAVGGLRFGR